MFQRRLMRNCDSISEQIKKVVNIISIFIFSALQFSMLECSTTQIKLNQQTRNYYEGKERKSVTGIKSEHKTFTDSGPTW